MMLASKLGSTDQIELTQTEEKMCKQKTKHQVD